MNRNLYKAFAIFLFLSGTNAVTAHSPAAAPVLLQQEQPRAQKSANSILASTSFSWVDITAVGTPFAISDWVEDDEGQASIGLPWPFPWFGDTYSTLYVDANGNVGFEDWPVDTWIADNRIPSPGDPNNRIAAFYMDMAGPDTQACGGEEGAVYTYSPPAGDRFIVEYDRWCTWGDYQLNTFEIILYPDGRVVVQYQDMQLLPPMLKYGNPPGESPVGIESPDGESGLAWYGKIQNGAAWLYQPYESIGENRLYLPLYQGFTP
jgi:hypothetical protein